MQFPMMAWRADRDLGMENVPLLDYQVKIIDEACAARTKVFDDPQIGKSVPIATTTPAPNDPEETS